MALIGHMNVFSRAALQEALARHNWDKPRLIISCTYMQSDILEIIFSCRGSLDIPFEKSYALPSDAWLLVDSAGDNILVSNPC